MTIFSHFLVYLSKTGVYQHGLLTQAFIFSRI